MVQTVLIFFAALTGLLFSARFLVILQLPAPG